MSHEVSITIQGREFSDDPELRDKFFNLNSVIGGPGSTPVSQAEAIQFARENKGFRGPFNTVQDAVRAAGSRSDAFSPTAISEDDKEEFELELSLMEGASSGTTPSGQGISATAGGFADPFGTKPGGGDFDINTVPEDLRFEFLHGKKLDGVITSRQFAAGMVGQETLEGGEPLSFLDRMRIALFARGEQQRQDNFATIYPSGDLRTIDGIEIFRRHPSENYSIADKPFFDSIGGFGFSDPVESVTDIGELIAGDLLVAAAQVGTAVGLGGKGQAAKSVIRNAPGVLRKVAAFARKPVVSEALVTPPASLTQQQLQQIKSGVKRKDFAGKGRIALYDGALALGFGLPVLAVVKGNEVRKNLVRGFKTALPGTREANIQLGTVSRELAEVSRGSVSAGSLTPEQVVSAQEKLGTLGVEMASAVPLVRQVGRFAGRMTPEMVEDAVRKRKGVAMALLARRDPAAFGSFLDQSIQRLQSKSNKLILGIKEKLRLVKGGTSTLQAGADARKGIKIYTESSSVEARELYAARDALNADRPPEYDMNFEGALDELEQLSRGSLGQTREQTRTRVVQDTIGLYGPDGKPLPRKTVVETFREPQRVAAPKGDLADLFEIALKHDPNAPPIEGSATNTKFLQDLRAAFWDHGLPTSPGATRNGVQRLAVRASSRIGKVLDNPTLVTPEARAANQKATEFWRIREETLEKIVVMQLAASDNKAAGPLVRALFKEDAMENILFLKAAMPPGKWASVPRAFDDILWETLERDGPDALLDKLARIDRRTLDELMPRDVQDSVIEFSKKLKLFNESFLAKGIKNHVSVRSFTNEILVNVENRTANLRVLDELLKDARFADRAPGRGFVDPQNTDFAISVRAAIFDNILYGKGGALKTPQGGAISIDTTKYNAALKKLKDSGLFDPKYLTRSDMQLLNNAKGIQQFIAEGGGSAAGLAAAGEGATVISKPAALLGTIIKLSGLSRFLMSDFAKRMIVQEAGKPLARIEARRLWKVSGVFLSDLIAQLEGQEDIEAKLKGLQSISRQAP